MFKLPIKQVVVNDDTLVTEVIAEANEFITPAPGDAGNLISIEGYGSFLVPSGTGSGWVTTSTAAVAGIYTITPPVTTFAIGQVWDLKIYFKQGPRILADVGMQGDSILLQSRPLAVATAAGWVDAFIATLDVNPAYLGDDLVLDFTDGGGFLIVNFREGYEGADIEIARTADALDIDSLWITCTLATTTSPEIGINTGKQIEAEVRLATLESLNPYGIYVIGNEPFVDIEGAYTETHWRSAIGDVNLGFAPHEMLGYGDVNSEATHMPSEYSVFTNEVTATAATALVALLLSGGAAPSPTPAEVIDVTDGTPLSGAAVGTGQVDSVVVYAGTIGTGALTYLSANELVATVDAAGLVTYVGTGSTTVTATSVENGSFSGTTTVTVS
jgi:hypothetical protein